MKKYPYAKAAGISVGFHALLLGILTIGYHLIASPSVAAPIEVNVMIAGTDRVKEANSSQSIDPLRAEQPAKQEKQQLTPNKTFEKARSELSKSSYTSGTGDTNMVSADRELTAEGAVQGNSTEVIQASGSSGQASDSTIRTQPGYISGPRPTYPQDARKAGQEGVVVIRVLVGTDGSATDTSVFASSGYRSLDEAAARAVKRWRFSPARSGSLAVESYYDVRVTFRLAD
jgi:protein TonB